MLAYSAGFKMIVVVGLLAVLMNTVSCADVVEAKGVVSSGDAAPVDSNLTTVIPPSSTVPQNITVVPVVTTSEKEEKDDEKPITETIRTYIEDGVKSVKHAISKIGKFVGEFFEDTPATNSTVSTNKTTTVIPSTVIPTSTPAPPTTDSE